METEYRKNSIDSKEFKNMQRILEITKDDNNFSREDRRKILYAFEKLIILKKKNMLPEFLEEGRRIFLLNKEEYQEKMEWINEFMKSKGFLGNIFRDTNDYNKSCADYDYYYELKTPSQYKKEEEERNQKKSEDKQKGE